MTTQDLKELAAIHGACLSIFEPLRDTFSQVTKSDTRLVAAAQKADALLAEQGYPAEERENFLRPIHKLAKNTDWSGRSGSFVVLRAPGFTKSMFWPGILESRVELADEFFVLPLLPGLDSHNFWLLALSMKRIKLFRGTPEGLRRVDLAADVPLSLAEAGGFNQPDHDLEGRSAPGTSSGQSAPIRFGTSAAHETKWLHLHDFFKIIDRAIRPILAQTADPLILAGIAREQAAYREVNSWPHLLQEGIHGSADVPGESKLHERALELAAAVPASSLQHAERDMDAAAGAKLLSTDPLDILHAAAAGRVKCLFIAPVRSIDEKLINSAVLGVLDNSGTVVCGNVSNAPQGVAAILRYGDA